MLVEEFFLTLADGTRLALRAGDDEAARVVAFLANAAQLTPAAPLASDVRHLLVVTEGNDVLADADVICMLERTDVQRVYSRQLDENGRPTRVLEPVTEEQWLWRQLVRLSAAISRETHLRGGVLLHSGLAAFSMEGAVLLAGRSGIGKTTASNRLPPPWVSCSDDLTLLVRDDQGSYWAHPWPTWSRFFGEEAGAGSDTWDVQRATELRAIFFLEQSAEDGVEPIGVGHAVSLLVELAQQTSTHLLRGLPLAEIAAFNLQRFENLCALAQAMPAYLLHVRLDGTFWEEIERVI